LAELLHAHSSLEPSPSFVDDTMLRLLLDRAATPQPTPDFVDRVLDDRRLDAAVPNRAGLADRASRAAVWSKVIAAGLAAAAVVVALWPTVGDESDSLPPLEAFGWPGTAPRLDESPAARAASLVRPAFGDPAGGGVPVSTFYLPLPTPLAIEAGVIELPEPWENER
jgi:hypothetical protein